MGRAHRGYVLIAVLAALTLCLSLAAAFAAGARRDVAGARAEIDRAQAQYVARGAAIQAAKDLSVGVNRPIGPVAGASTVIDESTGRASVQIEGLPAFPAEMAGASGLLGAIADRMAQIRAARDARDRERRADSPPAPETPEQRALREARESAEREERPAPLVVTGEGRMNIGEAGVDVVIESETGKLNVNVAPRLTLLSLLEEIGLETDDANALLDAIEDHRLVSGGAPAMERYAGSVSNLRSRLRGRNLEHIEELASVPGLSVEVYEAIVPHLTVIGDGVVDPNYATPEVLFAIGVRNERTIERLLAMRLEGRPISRVMLQDLLGPALSGDVEESFAYTLQPVYTVRARAVVGSSVGRCMIRVSRDEQGRPKILECREGWL